VAPSADAPGAPAPAASAPAPATPNVGGVSGVRLNNYDDKPAAP